MWAVIRSAIQKWVNSDLTTPLNATIGKKTDTAGTMATSSLFSWVKSIWNTLGTVNTTVNTVNTNVNTINTNTARGAVKSVQRGVLGDFTTQQSIQNTSITISGVTPTKCDVTVFGGYTSGTAFAFVSAPRIISLSATALVVYQGSHTVSGTTYFGQVSWQIVEYY